MKGSVAKKLTRLAAVTFALRSANSFSLSSHRVPCLGEARCGRPSLEIAPKGSPVSSLSHIAAVARPANPTGCSLFSTKVANAAVTKRGRLKLLLSRVFSRFDSGVSKVRRTVAILWVALTAFFLSVSSASAIPSGGRMGGSFKSSNFSPSSIAAPSRSGYHGSFGHGPLPPSGLYMRASANDEPEVAELSGTLVQRPASPKGKDVRVVDPVTYYTALTCAYGLGVYRVKRSREKSEQRKTALGVGASVLKVSVALDVSNRDDDSSILSRLKDISETAKTSSRNGVQDLISEVALELLRQRDAITSACSTYMHCSGPSQAEIEFNRMSTYERAKFGKETVNIFNDIRVIGLASKKGYEDTAQATSAVVSLLVSIEGDRTKVPNIISRRDLDNALMRVAADAQVDDCLLSAEVLWTPEDRTITLSNQDVVANYPQLIVI